MNPGLHPSLLLTVPAAAAVAGAALLVYALRGRRVDDHPICRRCGFDLFGKPQGATVCSECGADLSRPRAVRVGRREKRRALIKLAAPLMLLSLGLLGVQAWAASRGVDWNRHKPAWWLAREAGGADAATRDAALAELVRRIRDGSLAREREEALVTKALAHQADWDQPWVPAWGAVVEAARNAGRLSDGRWEQYLMSAVPYTLAPVQPAYRRAHDIGFNVTAATPRLSARVPANTFAIILCTDGTLVTNGQPHRATLPTQGAMPQGWPPLPGIPFATQRLLGLPSQATAWTRFDDPAMPRPADGRQVTRMSLVLVPFLPRQPPQSQKFSAGPVTRQLEATWTLLPDARTDSDPRVQRAVEASLATREVRHWWDTRRGRQSKGRLACEITCHNPPVDLVYRVSFQWQAVEPDGTTRPSGSPHVCDEPLHFRPWLPEQRARVEVSDARPLGAPPPQWVHVVLTPWPQAAPAGVSVIGGGEVVLRNVPVRTLREQYAAEQ